jgi:hypothetical protein
MLGDKVDLNVSYHNGVLYVEEQGPRKMYCEQVTSLRLGLLVLTTTRLTQSQVLPGVNFITNPLCFVLTDM